MDKCLLFDDDDDDDERQPINKNVLAFEELLYCKTHRFGHMHRHYLLSERRVIASRIKEDRIGNFEINTSKSTEEILFSNSYVRNTIFNDGRPLYLHRVCVLVGHG